MAGESDTTILKEIEIWEKLNNITEKPQTIPKFHGYQKEVLKMQNCQYYLFFDFFPYNLKDLIDEHKRKKMLIPFEKIKFFYDNLINTLAFLETLQICHRDLKPSNLLLDENYEQIYLIDFGISKDLITNANIESKALLTAAGTPLYFSPEVHKAYNSMEESENRIKLNPFKSDVYSFALIILEMGTFRLPNKNDPYNLWEKKCEILLNEFKESYNNLFINRENKKNFVKFLENLQKCFSLNPKDRPNFIKLFYQKITDYEQIRKDILQNQQFLDKIHNNSNNAVSLLNNFNDSKKKNMFKSNPSFLCCILNKKIIAIGNYILCCDEKLGAGAFGEVFKGYEKADPSNLFAIKQVSINVSDKELLFLKNFLENEVLVMESLSHPNIIKCFDMSITSNNIYIITELCNQGDLDAHKQDLTVNESLICLKQIVKAMLYANTENIIHRDLKPANILLNDGVLKLADFGFARFVDDPDVQKKMTCKKGSPLYMAPEVYDGEQYDAKCDVWSVGIMFYDMLFKKTPWYGSSAPDLFNNNIKLKPLKFPKNTDVDEEIIDLITKMLALNKKERFSFKEVSEHDVLQRKIPDKLKFKEK